MECFVGEIDTCINESPFALCLRLGSLGTDSEVETCIQGAYRDALGNHICRV